MSLCHKVQCDYCSIFIRIRCCRNDRADRRNLSHEADWSASQSRDHYVRLQHVRHSVFYRARTCSPRRSPDIHERDEGRCECFVYQLFLTVKCWTFEYRTFKFEQQIGISDNVGNIFRRSICQFCSVFPQSLVLSKFLNKGVPLYRF